MSDLQYHVPNFAENQQNSLKPRHQNHIHTFSDFDLGFHRLKTPWFRDTPMTLWNIETKSEATELLKMVA